MIRHFLDLDALDATALRDLLDQALTLKRSPTFPDALRGKTVAMIFEKPSTRTRFSFERAIHDLGGHAIVVNKNDMQLGRGETVADTARVLSRYVDAIVARTLDHRTLVDLKTHSTVPIINALSDHSHPCQILADVLTVQEAFGPLPHPRITWIGDPNNVFFSWLQACLILDFPFTLNCPPALFRDDLKKHFSQSPLLTWEEDPLKAVNGAHVVMTDTWVSMGCPNPEAQMRLLTPYQVNETVMKQADPQAIFLHCLPAVRGQEVTDAVMDGPQSRVFDQAENRLHAQRALLLWCLQTPRA
ncbi:MAG: ornithine carbamoyltransferase [Alphaproteobacteria bacterium]